MECTFAIVVVSEGSVVRVVDMATREEDAIRAAKRSAEVAPGKFYGVLPVYYEPKSREQLQAESSHV